MKRNCFVLIVLIAFVLLFSQTVFALEEDGLIAHYSFDGNGKNSASNNGYRDGEHVGNPTYVDGVKGQAVSISLGNYIRVPAEEGYIPGTDSFSIAVHYFVESDYGFGNYGSAQILTLQGGDFAEGVALGVNPDVVWCSVQTEAYTAHTGQVARVEATLGEWHHVVFVVDRSAQKFITYLDGEEKSNVPFTISGSIDPTMDMLIGAYDYIPPITSGEILLDDLRIYNRALSADEIEDTEPLTITKTYWRTNKCDGEPNCEEETIGEGYPVLVKDTVCAVAEFNRALPENSDLDIFKVFISGGATTTPSKPKLVTSTKIEACIGFEFKDSGKEFMLYAYWNDAPFYGGTLWIAPQISCVGTTKDFDVYRVTSLDSPYLEGKMQEVYFENIYSVVSIALSWLIPADAATGINGLSSIMALSDIIELGYNSFFNIELPIAALYLYENDSVFVPFLLVKTANSNAISDSNMTITYKSKIYRDCKGQCLPIIDMNFIHDLPKNNFNKLWEARKKPKIIFSTAPENNSNIYKGYVNTRLGKIGNYDFLEPNSLYLFILKSHNYTVNVKKKRYISRYKGIVTPVNTNMCSDDLVTDLYGVTKDTEFTDRTTEPESCKISYGIVIKPKKDAKRFLKGFERTGSVWELNYDDDMWMNHQESSEFRSEYCDYQ